MEDIKQENYQTDNEVIQLLEHSYNNIYQYQPMVQSDIQPAFNITAAVANINQQQPVTYLEATVIQSEPFHDATNSTTVFITQPEIGVTKEYEKKQTRRVRQRCGNSSPATYKGIKRTYAELCELAINSTDDKKMMLKDIYNWIQTNVPEFSEDYSGGPTQASWKNSVRHNLSLHKPSFLFLIFLEKVFFNEITLILYPG